MQTLITFSSRHALLTLLLLALLLMLFIVEVLGNKRKNLMLSAAETVSAMNHQHAIIVDIRSKEAYQQHHIINAISILPDALLKDEKKLTQWKNKPLILVCVAGSDAQKLAAILVKKGYNAKALKGGMRGWKEAGLPLVKSS